MEISEIIMEAFTLGTAISLNMTHNVSFYAESLYLEGLIHGGAYFEFNWKTNLFAKRVRTNIGRVTAKTYSGDRHFHNVRYFNILNV